MAELLTDARRHERVGSPIAPAIAVRCLGSEIWISREARLVSGAWLRNVGTEVARRIAIPDLRVDDDVWCRFGSIDDLEPGEEASLDPVICLAADKTQLEHATLSGLISRAIVARVLAGQPLRTEWPFCVTYEDCARARYVSRCAIQMASLPLTLRVSTTRISREMDRVGSATSPRRRMHENLRLE
jgi:hypothetical protein